MARCPAGHQTASPRGCARCHRDQVAEIAAAADGSLLRPVIEAAVDAVAPSGQALRQLALALSADPGALAAGAPPVAGKLAAALIARGSAVLTVPACTVCGRAGKPLSRGDAGSAVCQRCRSWQLAVACASCGKVRPRAGRDDAGQPACEVCFRRDNPRRHRRCGACGPPVATTWLFPGHLPGRPITPSRLGERLRDIGIYAQTGRRATMLDLAAQLPAAVLADLLDLHENTAAKWIDQAGGDWTRYAAELARNHPRQH